jgi:gliding motility-associated lipoprotein GldD
MKHVNLICTVCIGVFFFFACSPDFTPKPRGYYRIDLPETEYQLLEGEYPYTFQYPKYATINAYKGMWEKTDTSGYWINIELPLFRSRIHLTYKAIHGNLARMVDDAHTFAYKHSVKADAIVQSEYRDSLSAVYGVLFDIKGNTASSIQFYATDSTANFLRGALYFDCEPNKDSLAPVQEFLRKDIIRLVQTLRWKTLKHDS